MYTASSNLLVQQFARDVEKTFCDNLRQTSRAGTGSQRRVNCCPKDIKVEVAWVVAVVNEARQSIGKHPQCRFVIDLKILQNRFSRLSTKFELN